MITHWNKNEVFLDELWIEDGEVLSMSGKMLPDFLFLPMFEKDMLTCELVIEFNSIGYYDPGQFYGPPENCYPPEHDDERIPLYGCLENNGKKFYELSQNELDNLFQLNFIVI